MRIIRKFLHTPLLVSCVLSLLAFGIVLGLRSTGMLNAVELTLYDLLFRTRPVTGKPDPRIVLITIADADIEAQGTWPLPDQTLADALEILTHSQPRVIGLDLYRHFAVPPGTAAFEAILRGHPHIIGVNKFGTTREEAIPPPPSLQDTEQVGFNDFIVDPGGIVRRGLLFLDDGTHVFSSLALRLALLYLHQEGISPRPDPANAAYLRLGKTTIRPFEAHDGGYVGADARGYQFLFDFHGAPQDFQAFSLTALLQGKVPPDALRDKIVLIGVTVTESVKDFFFTPYSAGQHIARRMAGITLHAHATSQLLRAALHGQALITTVSDRYEALWFLVWSLLGGAMGLWARSLWRFVLSSIGGGLLLGGVVYAAFVAGWWLPVVPSALSWLLAAAVVTTYMANQEKEQRALLMQLFSRHVSPEVAATVWQHREQFLERGRLRPQRLVASVLFTDLMGFTSVSEKMPPQELMEWLNEYMEAMVQRVIDHGGVINKYIGDAIMALFGVPLARTTEAAIAQDAVHAVHCALAMSEELTCLNQRWQAQGLPTIGMRVGIFTGPVVAGSLGSAQRLEYTVVGDTVNTASRLESFDKDVLVPDAVSRYCRILVGETTARYLSEQFQMQRVGEVSLKGKDEKVTIYHVTGFAAPQNEPLVQQENRG